MDIRILEYFLTVAREESITKAAETLHMTQPPLSRQLKKLEDELGKQLLVRESRKVTLTEDGMLLRRRAEEIIDLMERTKTEMKSTSQNICGDVYIGSGETKVISFISKTAESLCQKGHSIQYNIYSGDADRVKQRLDKGSVDFGLLIEPVDIEKYDYVRLPIKDTWGVLMHKDSPLAQKERITPEDLWDKPLIIPHQLIASSEMSGWFKSDLSKLKIAATYDLIYNASHFVQMRLGYAITLDQLINTTGDSSLCFRPLSPALESGVCIVWKKYRTFSRAAELFLQQLRLEIEQTV